MGPIHLYQQTNILRRVFARKPATWCPVSLGQRRIRQTIALPALYQVRDLCPTVAAGVLEKGA